jgi:capsular polysaccharide biosynthesis protein
VVLVSAVAVGAAVYFVVTTPASYRAVALVRVDQRVTNIDEALAAQSLSQRLASTYARIVTTRALATRVATKIGGVTTTDEVLAALSAAQLKDLDLLQIMAAGTDATRVALIANTAADELRAFVDESSAGTQGERLLVVDPAVPPDAPSGPSALLVVISALVAGFTLGSVLALIIDLVEDRISDPEELEAMTGLPILGIVPAMVGEGVRR